MTNNIITTSLAISEVEQADLSITEAQAGEIRVALTHPNASVSFYFSTPADAWKFGQAVAAFAVKVMKPVEVEG